MVRALSQRFVLMIADAMLINAGVLLATLIRFDGTLPDLLLLEYKKVLIPFTVISLLGFAAAGLYSSLWKYASVDEIFVVIKGATASLGALLLSVYVLPDLGKSLGLDLFQPVEGFPKSVAILQWLLTLGLVGGLRLSFRFARRIAQEWKLRLPQGRAGRRRVLVVGAGDAGSLVIKELRTHGELAYEPVGIIDDSREKQGLKVHNLPVLGTRKELAAVASKTGVEEVIIAMPSAPGRVIREIVESLRDVPVKIKTLPGIFELLGGKVSFSQIREVQIEDLLGREPVDIDVEVVASYLRGQRILVTGAGGSIGSELCRQVACLFPASILLLDNSENGVFETSLDLKLRFPDLTQTAIVADLRDADRISAIFARYRPDVVFHAGAHKHVPLMEEHPDEAIKTNVFGTRNVAETALRFGVKRFVMISTDKAVNPSSVMGSTKRVAEMIMQSLDSHRRQAGAKGPRFVAVRFGNVLGSRGSVVPVFKQQIAQGGPVTVTHAEMRRYFMTIPEAAQLVIQAAGMGDGGEIFVLDMGQPVRIVDLAENLIRLSGFEPGIDIPIVFTGPRPGEKLFEELLTEEEGAIATAHKRIFIGRIPEVESAWLARRLEQLHFLLQQSHLDSAELVRCLKGMIADVRPGVAVRGDSSPFEPSLPRAVSPGGD